MELELGVVCGRCDRYSAMGTPACAECGMALDMGTPADAAAGADRSPPPPAPVEAMAGSPAPTSFLFAGEHLKPRRPPSGQGFPAGSVSTVRAQGGESALSSPGAPENRAEVTAPDDDAAKGSIHAPHAATRARPESSLEEQMEQAKNYVCKSCSTPVPLGHKFCGRRGGAARDPPGADRLLRPAPRARQSEADPHPRRGHRGAELSAQRRAAHGRPQRAARPAR